MRRLVCRWFGHRVVIDEVMGMLFPVCLRCRKLDYRWAIAKVLR